MNKALCDWVTHKEKITMICCNSTGWKPENSSFWASAAPFKSVPYGAPWFTKQNKWFTITKETRDGFNMLIFWTEWDYSSCGSEGLQLSEMAETADAVKVGERMKANYSTKESSVYGFSTFLFVQQSSFCTVYSKWLSPSMGYLGNKMNIWNPFLAKRLFCLDCQDKNQYIVLPNCYGSTFLNSFIYAFEILCLG